MKMYDLIANKDKYATYVEDEIKYVTTHFAKRTPGEKGEKDAAHYMAGNLKDYGCDEIKEETFTEHPRAFFGWIYITVTLSLIAAGLFFVNPIISLVLLFIAILAMCLEFVFYKQGVDFLFPKKEGVNVTAIKKNKNAKVRILLNGHIDAAWNWRVNNRFGGKVYLTHIVTSFVGIIVLTIVTIVGVIFAKTNFFAILPNTSLSPIFYTMIAVIAVFIFPWIMMYFMVDFNTTVDGANDNLTGCYLSIAVIKALKDNNISLDNVEIGAVLNGSEEAGLRGSKAWAKAHKDDYKDIPTYILCLDTIHDAKFLGVNTRDLNGTVKTNKEMADDLFKAAEEINLSLKKTKIPLFGGSSDASAFTQGGFNSICITALNHTIEDYYHTLKDTYENLNHDCLAKTFALLVKYIDNLNK